ncbi:MAG: CoB--CoM heterodisulfide reductase iron-sulfur subunit B family protein [Acidobacteriota bacterium]
MKEYAYFPGCSVKGTAKAYEESLLAVFKELGIIWNELEDWNCCGATIYMSVDETISFTLSSRNMALAEKNGKDIVAPCSACYLVLKKTKDYIEKYPDLKEKIKNSLSSIGLSYSGNTIVKHPLEIFVNDMGLNEIKRHVRKPLKEMKIAPYYGCQIVRPYTDVDNPIYPEIMDSLLESIGASVVEYPVKTRCCGGSLTGTIEEVGLRLNYILIEEAIKRGANCIAVLCPLCQFNLEAYQESINKMYKSNFNMPILYFTQVMGMAFGLSKQSLGMKRSIVSAEHFYPV